jgi:Tfp pilus assembly protein PilO
MEKKDKKNTETKKYVQPKALKKEGVVKKKSSITALLFVTVLNVILLALTFFVLLNLPKKSDELKAIKNQELDVKKSSNVQTSDLDVAATSEKIARLESIFPDDTGIVNFVKEIEKLKGGGIVRGITFVSQEAVRDKTKSLGIPFIIELEGSWTDIDATLTTIQKLPYLFRAVTIEVNINDEGVVNFKYGGFLYVAEVLSKSR